MHSGSFNGLATSNTICGSSTETPVALMVVGILALQQRTNGRLDACLKVCDVKLAEVLQPSSSGNSAHAKLERVV